MSGKILFCQLTTKWRKLGTSAFRREVCTSPDESKRTKRKFFEKPYRKDHAMLTSQATITKGNLHFTMTPDGQFVCQELVEIPARFESLWTKEEIDKVLKTFYEHLRSCFMIRVSSEKEAKEIGEEKRRTLALPTVDKAIAECTGKQSTRFQEFLFALSPWWYYHPEINEKLTWRENKYDTRFKEIGELSKKYLVPLLPNQIKDLVEQASNSVATVGFGHFAIYFMNKDSGVRRVVTDTQLIELRDVYGYNYIDISPDGKPFIRCCTERGGGRTFFDGTHLMSHKQFQTCAPKVVFFDGGYKVNSTVCTIINGKLYQLIEEKDAVAHTDGAFMGMCSFTRKQLMESVALSEATAKKLRSIEGKVTIGGRELKPVGVFQQSQVKLLENGFSLYDWSEFHEILTCRFDKVLVIDDKADWVKKVGSELAGLVVKIESFTTTHRKAALKKLLATRPDAVILDVHLTSDEQFDGLWIANQAIEKGYTGLIMLASSYGDKALEAMQVLVKGPTKAPGKNIERIKSCLYGK